MADPSSGTPNASGGDGTATGSSSGADGDPTYLDTSTDPSSVQSPWTGLTAQLTAKTLSLGDGKTVSVADGVAAKCAAAASDALQKVRAVKRDTNDLYLNRTPPPTGTLPPGDAGMPLGVAMQHEFNKQANAFIDSLDRHESVLQSMIDTFHAADREYKAAEDSSAANFAALGGSHSQTDDQQTAATVKSGASGESIQNILGGLQPTGRQQNNTRTASIKPPVSKSLTDDDFKALMDSISGAYIEQRAGHWINLFKPLKDCFDTLQSSLNSVLQGGSSTAWSGAGAAQANRACQDYIDNCSNLLYTMVMNASKLMDTASWLGQFQSAMLADATEFTARYAQAVTSSDFFIQATASIMDIGPAWRDTYDSIYSPGVVQSMSELPVAPLPADLGGGAIPSASSVLGGANGTANGALSPDMLASLLGQNQQNAANQFDKNQQNVSPAELAELEKRLGLARPDAANIQSANGEATGGQNTANGGVTGGAVGGSVGNAAGAVDSPTHKSSGGTKPPGKKTPPGEKTPPGVKTPPGGTTTAGQPTPVEQQILAELQKIDTELGQMSSATAGQTLAGPISDSSTAADPGSGGVSALASIGQQVAGAVQQLTNLVAQEVQQLTPVIEQAMQDLGHHDPAAGDPGQPPWDTSDHTGTQARAHPGGGIGTETPLAASPQATAPDPAAGGTTQGDAGTQVDA